ncbi:separin [Plectosphaerella plurivora]|uniref:separase n=1 Tax=Plectosphaerella plurivora TaxID=936078 RepID=A0A9P8VI72_9PEZI|nr:separin [Plectosphaerella plurivora]
MMTTPQDRADAVKTAVAATTTCTATTIAHIKELLGAENKRTETPATEKPGSRPRARTTTSKTPTSASKPTKEELPDDEKKLLAVHVVNGALKALVAAAKPPKPSTPDAVPPTERRRLRRSNSTPMTPLQPRTLNRVTTSPALAKDDRHLAETKKTDLGCLSMAECLRVAFAYLRSLQDAGRKPLPEHQLETGMARFVGAMITLGIHEQAQKELSVLKKRLDAMGKRQISTKADAAARKTLADLLDFEGATFSGPALELAVTVQIHTIRLISEIKNSALTELALPKLRASYPTSPLNLIRQMASESAEFRTKATRQLHQLSQMLLLIPPNVTTAEDSVAMEARLSPVPTAAIEYHILGLECRLRTWSISKNDGDFDNEILRQLSKCLSAFLRRCPVPTESAYQTCSKAFDRFTAVASERGLQASTDLASPTATIHQTLGAIAERARLWTEAASWFEKLRQIPTTETDSTAKRSVIAARLLSVLVRQPLPWPETVDVLLQELIESMQAPLRGDIVELDDMMESLSATRRLVARSLFQQTDESQDLPESTQGLSRSFILQFPRFACRWLGKNPGRDADAKKQLRFSKRKILVESFAASFLDSALSVLKSLFDTQKAAWDEVDTTLQHCLNLIEALGETHLPPPKDRSNTYHVKTSQLYYLAYSHAKRKGDIKTEFRALRRSVDAVKDRSTAEKQRAALSAKLERYSAFCKQNGRQEESKEALKSICTTMVEDGVLTEVATALDDKAPSVVWAANPKTQLLSRTLVSMAKLDQSWSDWTFFLPEIQRAAVLEHIVHMNFTRNATKEGTTPTASVTEALLRIYSIDKYPVRRLRTLLHLLVVNLDDTPQFDDLRHQVEATFEACGGTDLGSDTTLSTYVPDFRAYFESTVALTSADLGSATSGIESAVSSWQRILSGCKTGADLASVIDDPERLLKHLGSLAQFANLKGIEQLQLSTSETAAQVAHLLSEKSLQSLLTSYAALADTYVSLGYETKAEEVFAKVAKLPIASDDVCFESLANLHLSSVEYQLAVNNPGKAELILAEAKAAFEKQSSQTSLSLSQKLMLARAHLLYSLLALEKGEVLQALHHARFTTRMLYTTWTKMELQWKKAEQNQSVSSSALGSSLNTDHGKEVVPRMADGPEFWPIGIAVLRSLMRLSAVYQHLGIFQETLFYAEKSVEIAKKMDSYSSTTQAQSWLGTVWVKANRPEKGVSVLNQARDFVRSKDRPTHFKLRMACELSAAYGHMKDIDSEAELLQIAEDILEELNKRDGSVDKVLADQMQKLDLKPAATRATRAARTTKAIKTLATTTRAATTRTATTRATATTAPAATTRGTVKKSTQTRPRPASATPVPADEQFPALQKLMLIRKAFRAVAKNEWTAASGYLEEARQLTPTVEEPLEAQVTAAACLIGESLEQMVSDSVFSVVQDSTISFPSVASAVEKPSAEKNTGSASPPRKPRARAATIKNKAATQGFVQTLQRALQHLTEALSRAIVTGDGHLIHRIAALLQSTTIFLSAASNHDLKSLPHVDFATCSMELARNITWKRERRAVLVDSETPCIDEVKWPMALELQDESGGASVTDMAKFQSEYIDIIPSAWRTISMSLSDNRQDLCITKLEAGRSPFVLRLPLERASSRDADSEVFDFEHWRTTLANFIKRSNASCNSKDRDFSIPGSKQAWWKERQDLDDMMKELLETVEKVWLNGFKGIFSQHAHRPTLFAKFQKTFYTILDKHLPSRRPGGGKKTARAPKVTLDTRILDLFIGLGDPSEDSDLDEPLQDLLYFVVDILQFHGEHNAYDEVDFDSMTVDAMDALNAYHQAAGGQTRGADGAHTILVLDKSLHSFPWESMPCLQGDAISRVPSMACLRRLILEQKQEEGQPGHTVSRKLGTYMLNPGNDLPTTQEAFTKEFSALEGSWTSYVAQAPTDSQFATALRESDLLIYLGHGSGTQYIRPKTIRRLEKCRSVALLMGCSSGKLVDSGEFEVHGPVWDYMMAGCPAVVGTLWDVTDRDIDRYAGRLLEEWGIMEKGTFKTDKWSKRPKDEACVVGGQPSLSQAVEKARSATRFRYVTSGAICVYGIPVYVLKE